MTNAGSATTYNLIIRTTDKENLPDVENYVRSLHSKGYFKKLIDEGKLTVEEIQKLPFAKMCKIFFRKSGESLESGDIRIFKKSGDYTLHFNTGE